MHPKVIVGLKTQPTNWEYGFCALFQIVKEQWIISSIIIILTAYLCSDSETAIYAWLIIGVFAIYSAIKAVIEIIIEIKNYIKTDSTILKTVILQKIGGKIFDFTLCVIGIFQVLKVFSHITKKSQELHHLLLVLLTMLQVLFQNYSKI